MLTPFKALIEEYCTKIGLPNIQPNTNGEYEITFQGKYAVRCLLRNPSELIIESIVTILDIGSKKIDFGDVLQLHAQRLKDYPDILSLAPKTHNLILFRPVSLESLNIFEFEKQMSEFLYSLAFWRKIIKKLTIPDPIPRIVYPKE